MKKIYKNITDNLRIRTLIDADYQNTHDDMMHTVLKRIDKKKQGTTTPDELWLVEHNDVYTLGQAGKEEHILERGNTPIVKTDRGGQVTWHGKGQLVVYLLFDLNSLGWTVRNLVSHAEQSIEDVLNTALCSSTQGSLYYAKARKEAPGVYIYNKDDLMLGKIASLGFKIKHGFSYHGIALNLNCDLTVFNAINPCGYAGMQMLNLADFIELKHDNAQLADAKSDNKIKCEPIDDKPILPPYSSSCHSSSCHNVTGSVTKLGITQLLVDNLGQRHSGNIELRADKADNEA